MTYALIVAISLIVLLYTMACIFQFGVAGTISQSLISGLEMIVRKPPAGDLENPDPAETTALTDGGEVTDGTQRTPIGHVDVDEDDAIEAIRIQAGHEDLNWFSVGTTAAAEGRYELVHVQDGDRDD
jgi:hypothetical protein